MAYSGQEILPGSVGADALGRPAGTPNLNPIGQFGNSTAFMAFEGNIYRNIVGTAVNPNATGSDYVIGVYNLPASALYQAGQGLNIAALGSFGSNATAKVVKIIVGATSPTVGSVVSGGTTIASGSFTVTSAGWCIEANIFKYGAAGSNTQLAVHMAAQAGSTVATLVSPSTLTLTESAIIPIAITGNATTAVADIGLYFFEVNAMN